MVTLNLDREDCKNIAEILELFFFENIKVLLEAGELDNIDYVRSILKSLDELKVAKEINE